MEGLNAAPEWNGKRGLVESYDATKGRYRLLVKGRSNALGVRVACIKLEFAAKQEQGEHEADTGAVSNQQMTKLSNLLMQLRKVCCQGLGHSIKTKP